MLHLRRPISNVIGVLALSALVVAPTVMASAGSGASIRAQVIRSAAAPVGGAVTQKELPGCSNPSEPFAGASQGCGAGSIRFAMSNVRNGDAVIFDPMPFDRGPRQTTSLDGSFSRGPRQTTSLDGSINPETGGLVVDSVSRTKGFGFIKAEGGSERTYNSALASTSGVMGYGWSFPYAMSVRIYRGTATVTQENGSKVVFKRGADNRFHAAPRVIASFQQSSGGSYTLTRGSSRSTCPSYLLQSCDAFTFSNGHLSKVTSAPAACKSTEVCGNGFVRITRDGAGRPTSATADSGDRLTFGYTSGHITSITGPGGVSEHFTYDSRGNLSSATDPNGNTTHYTYDGAHRLTGVRDPLGRKRFIKYTPAGRVAVVTDPLGNRRTFSYNAVHHNTTITSPEGRRVVLAYPDSTVVDLRAAGPGGGSPAAEWTFAYAPSTLAVTKTVDPNLGVTRATSDADGMPLTLTDALGHTTAFTYSDAGRRSSVTDPMGVKTKFTYDENGNVLTRSTPNKSSGTTRVVTWISVFEDPAHPGDMTSSIDPLGNETDYTYDSRGNPASVTDPLGNTWTYSRLFTRCPTWEPPVDSVTDPLGHVTTSTCDENGNLLTTTDATGATTTNTYDADNELTSTTDPAGRTTTYSYDADGRLTDVHMPDGTTGGATYGADGELTSTVDPAGGTQGFTYDDLGRMVSAKDQLGRTTTFAYDSAGNLTSSTDAMGVTASNTYDADGTLLATSYSDGATPPVSYTYDADGRRLIMTDSTGVTTDSYDSLGALLTETDGAGDSTAYTYDLNGTPKAKVLHGRRLGYEVDPGTRITSMTDGAGHTTDFTYDSAGNLMSSSVEGGKSTTYEYDAANRITGIRDYNAASNLYASLTYTRAIDGRITGVSSTGLAQTPQSYTYDSNGRLGSENSNLLSFDSRDNITHLANGNSLEYDAADQLTSMHAGGATTTFSFNADGARTGSSSAAGTTSYGYDGAGNMTSYGSGTTTASYAYDGDSQRMSSSSGGVTHAFTWDSASARPAPREALLGWPSGLGNGRQVSGLESETEVVEYQDSRLAIPMSLRHGHRLISDGTNSYIYGPDGLPMEQINDTTGTALFLDHDAQGSTRVITDASGTVKGRVNYDAYGNVTFQSGTPTAFGYQGQYTDAESGLVTMGGTFYDPATGQSLTAARRLPGRTNWAHIQLSRGSLADPSTQRFVKILAAPLAEVRQNIEELHADLFIDSCSDSRAAANFDATSTWTRCPTFEPPVDIFLSPYGLPGGDPVSTASPWRYIAVRRTAM